MKRKLPLLLIAAAFTLTVLFSVPAFAGSFYAPQTGKCYKIVEKNLINKHFVILECKTCDCRNPKKKIGTRYPTISAAIDYLEQKFGLIEPR